MCCVLELNLAKLGFSNESFLVGMLLSFLKSSFERLNVFLVQEQNDF